MACSTVSLPTSGTDETTAPVEGIGHVKATSARNPFAGDIGAFDQKRRNGQSLRHHGKYTHTQSSTFKSCKYSAARRIRS